MLGEDGPSELVGLCCRDVRMRWFTSFQMPMCMSHSLHHSWGLTFHTPTYTSTHPPDFPLYLPSPPLSPPGQFIQPNKIPHILLSLVSPARIPQVKVTAHFFIHALSVVLASPLFSPFSPFPPLLSPPLPQDLVTAREEAFYFFDDEGQGQCLVFQGAKHRIAWLRNYLVCVHATSAADSTPSLSPGQTGSSEPSFTLTHAAAGGGSSDPRSGTGSTGDRDQVGVETRLCLTVFDVRSKLVVYSAALGGSVPLLLCEGGAVLLRTDRAGQPHVLLLGEQDMRRKLEALFSKGLFAHALELVQAHAGGEGGEGGRKAVADVEATAEVLVRYGDHLFERQEYGEAMQQYLRTIGLVEPSHVVQRFLSPRLLPLLASYLERLHEKGMATQDHHTLLLNAYARLKVRAVD